MMHNCQAMLNSKDILPNPLGTPGHFGNPQLLSIQFYVDHLVFLAPGAPDMQYAPVSCFWGTFGLCNNIQEKTRKYTSTVLQPTMVGFVL